MLDGGWEPLANAYADVLGLEQHRRRRRRPSIGKRLARVFEEELGDVAKAEETYRYVLVVEPHEREALCQPRSHLQLARAVARAGGVLEQRAQAPTDDSIELVELYTRLGQVYEERLGQVQRRDPRLPA